MKILCTNTGIDDNGCGSAAVREIARLLTTHKCPLNKTIILTLFHLEQEIFICSLYVV
jgi:Zn-dependent M28 family amino/carboxypeptidase